MPECDLCNHECYDKFCSLCCISSGELLLDLTIANRHKIISKNIERLEKFLAHPINDVEVVNPYIELLLLHMRSQVEDI